MAVGRIHGTEDAYSEIAEEMVKMKITGLFIRHQLIIAIVLFVIMLN